MPESPQVKRYLIYSIINLVHKLPHKLPHELPNDLRLRILGNQEILGNCQMWVQTQPNSQPSFQKLNVDNSCRKTCKIRYYIFEAQFYCISLLCANYFVQDCLSKQIFCRNLTQSPSHLNFWKISVTSKHFSNHDQNIKHASQLR